MLLLKDLGCSSNAARICGLARRGLEMLAIAYSAGCAVEGSRHSMSGPHCPLSGRGNPSKVKRTKFVGAMGEDRHAQA